MLELDRTGVPADRAASTAAGERILSLRSRTLEEVESAAEPLLERLGITRVGDVTGLDVVGIPVWHAVRPTAAVGLNTVTSGKGASSAAARVSAVMEAIERSCCEPRGRATVTASYERSRHERPTLDPRRLIPRRDHHWTPETEIRWWPTKALRHDSEVWIPAVAALTPFPREGGLLRSNTIGVAAGNDPAEATLHGLYEVVEHDSTAFGEVLGTGFRVRPETLPDSARSLIEQFERASVDVTVHAYTDGIGIPTFFAVTEDAHDRDGMLFNGGAGCHLDPETAVLRALTEAAQSRLAVIAGAREDLDGQAYRRHATYEALRTSIRAWSENRPWCAYQDFPARSTGTVAGDLEAVLDLLERAGLGLVLTTELAPEGFPFSVTKVVVPGTEFTHHDPQRIGPRIVGARARRDGGRAS